MIQRSISENVTSGLGCDALIRTFLIDGERRKVVFGRSSELEPDAAFAYTLGAVDESGWTTLAPSPFLERRLTLGPIHLFAPFGGKAKTGFREIFTDEPRVGRLWGRFSVDVPVAIERAAKFFDAHLFAPLKKGNPHGDRVFIMEDGDRYAVRAMCVFRTDGEIGTIVELLHDRSLDGLRHASHLLGLALRAMADSGATVARAAAFPHSGTIPVFVRHAFRRTQGLPISVKPIDPALADTVTRRESWYVSYVDFVDL